jgi:dolichol kinase
MHALKIVLLIIALVLLIVSVATPEWLEFSFSPTDNITIPSNMGLWESCGALDSSSKSCTTNTPLTGNMDQDATVNSLRTLSLLSIVLVAIAILCCFICKNKAPVMVLICIALLSCISTIGVFAGKVPKTIPKSKEGYSFWLQVAAACVLLLVFVMKLMVKGKKM